MYYENEYEDYIFLKQIKFNFLLLGADSHLAARRYWLRCLIAKDRLLWRRWRHSWDSARFDLAAAVVTKSKVYWTPLDLPRSQIALAARSPFHRTRFWSTLDRQQILPRLRNCKYILPVKLNTTFTIDNDFIVHIKWVTKCKPLIRFYVASIIDWAH